MRLHHLRVKGIGRLRDEVNVPIDELGDAQLVAVTGTNGAGKTTLIECVPGSLYGAVPSHGKLISMANAPDTLVESVIETDQRYTLRWLINAVRTQPKTEAYIIDEAGAPLNDGKQASFFAEVSYRFASARVYLASGFAAQQQVGQFLQVPRADRKALFAEMLGLGYLQRIADAAGARADKLRIATAGMRGRQEILRAQAESLDEHETRHVAEQVELTAAQGVLGEVESEIEARTAARSEWERNRDDARRAVEQAQDAVDTATEKVRRYERDLSSVKTRLKQYEDHRRHLGARLEARPTLLAEVEAAAGVDAAIESTKADIAALAALAETYRTADAQRVHDIERAEAEMRRLTERRDAAIDAARDRHAEASRQVMAAKVTAHDLQTVPCSGVGQHASCKLIASAITAQQALPALQEAAADALQAIAAARQTLDTEVDAATARFEELVTRPRESTPDIDTTALEAKLRDLEAQRLHARECQVRLDSLSQAELDLAICDDEIASLTTEAGECDNEVSSINRRHDTAVHALRVATKSLAAAESDPPPPPDHEAHRAAKEHVTAAITRVAQAEAAVTAARAAAASLEELSFDLAAATEDYDDWVYLRKAFGPNGIQALEIDAAGPDVSGLINDLLHSCYGARFSCALETTALRKSGGTKEIFDLRVIDAEMGRDGSASDLSGGERVIVAEALSMAIAIYNARRSAVPILDLWRDECSGALHPDTAPVYLTMLRQAIEVGDFHRVYFVTHQPELWEMADARLHVEDGQCQVIR